MFDKTIKQEFSRAMLSVIAVFIGYSIMFWAQFHFNLYEKFSLFIFVFTSSVILYKPYKGFCVFVFFAILSETHFLYGFDGFQSIYTSKIHGFTLIDIMLLLIVFRSIFELLKETRLKLRLSPWDAGFIMITAISIIASIWAFLFTPSIKNWLVDIKYLLFLILPFFILRFYVRDVDRIKTILKIIYFTLFGKTIVYLVAYLIQFRLSEDLVVRVTLTSDGMFYPSMLLICFTIPLLTKINIVKVFSTLMGVIITLVLFWSFWREAWFWCFLSICIFYFLSETTFRQKMIKFVGIGILLIISLVSILRPQTWNYAYILISTYTLNPQGKGESESGAIRGIEWVNIHHLLSDTNTTLFGRGMGSTWTDRYHSLPKRFDPYSFPIEETEHISTHMILSKLYLKFGIIGTLLFLGSLFIPWYKSFLISGHLILEYKLIFRAVLISCIGIFAKLELIKVALFAGLIFGIFSSIHLVLGKKIIQKFEQIS